MDKDFITLLTPFLSLKSLNLLIKTSKRFAKYKTVVRKKETVNMDIFYNTNNQKIKEILYYTRPYIWTVKHFKNGQQDGEFKKYHAIALGNRLRSLTFYKHGKLNGMYQSWYITGELWLQYYYKDNQIHGVYQAWHPNGQPDYRYCLEYGDIHGEYQSWYSNGQLLCHGYYHHGKQHGEFKKYYENGQLCEHGHYNNGHWNGEYKLYYRSGQLGYQCYYNNGLDGESKSYYENGQLRMHLLYSRGNLVCIKGEWLEDGSVKHR